jgi:hypothetical protein
LHWNPQLYIVNSLGESKEQIWFNQYSISSYEKETDNILSQNFDNETVSNQLFTKKAESSRGSVIVERRRISGQFWQTLNLKMFPADVQRLTLTLTTPKQVNEIKIVHCKDKASSVNTKCFVDSQCWRWESFRIIVFFIT